MVASDTPPLWEVIQHNVTGRLVDFFDVDGLVDQVCDLLDNPEERLRLGSNARAVAVERYDTNVCLPKQLDWVYRLANQ